MVDAMQAKDLRGTNQAECIAMWLVPQSILMV